MSASPACNASNVYRPRPDLDEKKKKMIRNIMQIIILNSHTGKFE